MSLASKSELKPTDEDMLPNDQGTQDAVSGPVYWINVIWMNIIRLEIAQLQMILNK